MRTLDYIVIAALITQAVLNFYVLKTLGGVLKWMELQQKWNQAPPDPSARRTGRG